MTVTLDELATMVANGFAGLKAEISERFEEMDKHFELLEPQVLHIEAEVMTLRRDLERLEAKVYDHGNYAKEIDQLRASVIALESKVASLSKA